MEVKAKEVEQAEVVEEEEAEVVEGEESEEDVTLVEGLVLGLPFRALPVMSNKGSWSVWEERTENLEIMEIRNCFIIYIYITHNLLILLL